MFRTGRNSNGATGRGVHQRSSLGWGGNKQCVGKRWMHFMVGRRLDGNRRVRKRCQGWEREGVQVSLDLGMESAARQTPAA